jgi:glycosyltransferase involved in cell wall biosynthesis
MVMRLLMSANAFYPDVGGYERVALMLASQLATRGHEVKVITFSRGAKDEALPFEIYRSPNFGTLLRLFRWSDLYIQNNVSFKLLWPFLFFQRPLVFIHHGFYHRSKHTTFSLRFRLKHMATLFATNISVSRAVADSIPGQSHIILNAYRDDLFYRIPSILKNSDIFFVGRVVSDKGVDVLVEAIARLRDRGIVPTVTLAGSGPEEAMLRKKVLALGLEKSVTFAGRVSDERLNELLNAHKIMVVPTREGEGFGVVALEGIACGCVVVGSDNGGLPEAIGRCGRTFRAGDPEALANVLQELLSNQDCWKEYRIHAEEHLSGMLPSVVVDKYEKVLRAVLSRVDNIH